MKNAFLTWTMTVMLGAVVLVGNTGCNAFGEPGVVAAQTRADTAELAATLRADAQKDREAGNVPAAEAKEKAAEPIQKVSNSIVLDADGEPDLFASAAGLVPVYGPWILLAGTAFKWFRASRTASSIVKHVDKLMIEDPSVKAALNNLSPEAKEKAHALLTPEAKKLIDTQSVT